MTHLMPAEMNHQPPTLQRATEQEDVWDDVDGMVDFLNADQLDDGFLPLEEDLEQGEYSQESDFRHPAPHDAKRDRERDDGASLPKLPRTAAAFAQPPGMATAFAQPLPAAAAVPVDPEEQALLGELSSFLGSSNNKDSLRMALQMLRVDGESPASRGSTPPGVTPPSSPDQQPPSLVEQAGAAMGALGHSSAAAAQARSHIDYTRFMDSHGFGVMMMDMNGNFLQWNHTLQNLLGYSRDQMERLSMMHLTPVEDLPAMLEMMPRLSQSAYQPTLASPMQMTKRCTSRSGEDLTLSVRMSVVHTAGADGAPSTPFLTCLIDCHGPHTWAMPVRPSFNRPPVQMLTDSGSAIHRPTPPAHLPAGDGLVGAAAAAVGIGAAGTGAGGDSAGHQRQRRRVPLPREAVAELRAMLELDRYPQPEVREDLARRHGLERRRVDRWLENARAREASRGVALFKSEPS